MIHTDPTWSAALHRVQLTCSRKLADHSVDSHVIWSLATDTTKLGGFMISKTLRTTGTTSRIATRGKATRIVAAYGKGTPLLSFVSLSLVSRNAFTIRHYPYN